MPPMIDWVLHALVRAYYLVVALHPMIVTFLAAGVVTFAVVAFQQQQKVSVRGFLNHCFPWVHWKAATTRVDIFFYIANKLTQTWLTFVSGAMVIYVGTAATRVATQWLQIDHKLAAGPLAVGVVTLALVICADLGEYISHAVQHRVPMLWEFHKVHHSALFLTPLTTFRTHPVGNFVDGVFMGLAQVIPAALAQMLFGFSFLELIGMTAAGQLVFSVVLMTTLQHSHFPISYGVLDRLVMSPLMHQVHHSAKREHWGKNLGSLFSVWDWCFGTGVKLPKGEKLVFGLGTPEDARGDYSKFWWCYVGPVVHCYRIVRRALGRRGAASAGEIPAGVPPQANPGV